MPKAKLMPSADYLRACLDYNPETGELRWKQRPREHFALPRIWKKWNTMHAGTLAGTKIGRNGCRIGLAGSRTTYATHRVIWKWVTGEEPSNTVDHKDINFRNNRWENLRLATRSEQQWNKRRSQRSLPRGVYKTTKGAGWWSQIQAKNIKYHLGTFSSIEAAAAAYEAAARNLQGVFYSSK